MRADVWALPIVGGLLSGLLCWALLHAWDSDQGYIDDCASRGGIVVNAPKRTGAEWGMLCVDRSVLIEAER